ncbi:D-alanyl-D-alanine carboxypeptidase [Streptomyces sp. NPDC127069]|uniref:D-alanyl-D-alanine carboxypeptidase n=1 Tax=Streptomyces sp. NPDC127069 TaxID=3347128 RepID=UPI0036642491
MKAETVAGDGETLALTGREGADAEARALAGREPGPAGAEPEPGTGTEGAPVAAAGTPANGEGDTAAREASDGTDALAPGGQEPAGIDEPATERQSDAAEPEPESEPGNGREGASDAATASPPTNRDGEPAAREASQDMEPRAAGTLTPTGREQADTAEPAAAEATGSAAPNTPARREPAVAEAGPGTGTASARAQEDRAVPDAPDAAVTPSGAGAPAEEEPRSGGTRAAGRGASGRPGSAKAEDAAAEDRTSASDGPAAEAEPGGEEQETPVRTEPDGHTTAARDSRPAQNDAPGKPGAVGADAAAEGDTPAAKASGDAPAGAPGRGTPAPEPVSAKGGEVTDEPGASTPGAEAPVRRPSWAKRDTDRTEGTEDGAGTTPARRPSWAKGGTEAEEGRDTAVRPEGDGAATAALGKRTPGSGAAVTPRPDGERSGASGAEAPGTDGEANDRRTAGAPADGAASGRTADRRSTGASEPAAGRQPEGGAGGQPAGEPDGTPAQRKGAAADRADGKPTSPRQGQGTARAAASRPHDPERTSEFLPLKDPDAAATKPGQASAPPVLEPTRETPRPALDLLAELTNTPPPPETPARTLTRRVKVWTPIVLLLGAAVAGGQMLRPLPDTQLVAAQDSVTLDGTTSLPWPAKGQGAVRISGSGDIATFGEQKPVPTASVAKAMTAYVILKNHPLRKDDPGPQIEIDAQAAAESNSDDESRIKHLTVGQKFSQRELLKMVMVPSANNIARLLARWDGGSGGEAAFVAKMNAAARDLGMRDTTYTDPSGLTASTVSTAVDQLKLAEAAMQDEAFRAIVTVTDETIKGVVEPLHNSNDLLWVKGLGNKGIKTGSSTAAGGTLVWAADKSVGGETPMVLGALMDQHADGPDPQALRSLALVLDNSRKVIEAVRKALASTPVIHKGQTVGHVSDGLGGRTPLVATKDLSVIGVPGQKLRLTLGTAGGKPVPHAAAAGTEVGVLTVGEGPGAKTVPVAVGKRLAEPSFGTRVTRLS